MIKLNNKILFSGLSYKMKKCMKSNETIGAKCEEGSTDGCEG